MSSYGQQRTIGKYSFPIYSHPVFRAQVSDNAYVQQRVEAELQQQDMQAAMDDLVERLLAEGREGASEADIEELLQQQLGALDPFFARGGDAEDGVEAPTTAEGASTSRKNAFWGTETVPSGPGTASDGFIGASALQARPTTYTLTNSQRQHSPPPPRLTPLTSSVGGGASPPPPLSSASVSVKHSKLMPDMVPAVVSQGQYMTPPPDQARAHTAPSETTSTQPCQQQQQQLLPQWRSAMRTTVYSLLHLRMEEQGEDVLDAGHNNSNGKHITIAQVETARQNQRAIDHDQLRHLAPEEYGMMDVFMDGNSTCISRRTNHHDAASKKKLTPMQLSQRLQEQKRLEQQHQQLRQAPQGAGRLYAGGAAGSSMDPKTRRVVDQHQKTLLRKQQQQQQQQQTAYMGFSGMPPPQPPPEVLHGRHPAAMPRSSINTDINSGGRNNRRSGDGTYVARGSVAEEVPQSSDRWSRGTAYERAMKSVQSFGR